MAPLAAVRRICDSLSMTSRNAVPLLVAAMLFVSGCGGDDGGDTTTKAAPATTLSAPGYRALADFNKLTKSDAGPETVARRCERIGPSGGFDEQVDAVREFCLTVADIGRASKDVEACAKDESEPLAVRRCIAGALDQMAAYARDAVAGAKAVVRAAELDPGACRDYLLDERELSTFRSFGRTAEQVARVLRDEDATQTQLEAATSRLEISFRRFERAGGGDDAARAKACAPAS